MTFNRLPVKIITTTPTTTGKTVRIQLEIQLNPGETLAVDSDSRVEGWVEVISQ